MNRGLGKERAGCGSGRVEERRGKETDGEDADERDEQGAGAEDIGVD
jgi:hypothetical protein